MYGFLRSLDAQTKMHLRSWGNTTIPEAFVPFTWHLNNIIFQVWPVIGVEKEWTWGILQMSVKAMVDCMYRRSLYQEATFVVNVPGVGDVAEGGLGLFS